MYQLDPDSGEIREYTDYFSTEAERQYWMKIVDLAYDIFDTLVFYREERKTEVRNLQKRKTIYLAETGHDLSVQRNIIKRELQRHGYLVLPNQTLPGNLHDLEKTVRKDLLESNLSIHLIGSAYGEIPVGAERSVVDLQNKLAAEKSIKSREDNEDFTRLIWISFKFWYKHAKAGRFEHFFDWFNVVHINAVVHQIYGTPTGIFRAFSFL